MKSFFSSVAILSVLWGFTPTVFAKDAKQAKQQEPVQQEQQYPEQQEQVAPCEETGEDCVLPETEDFAHYICHARNRRGHIFRGADRFEHIARREALYRCQRVSRYCAVTGCQFVY